MLLGGIHLETLPSLAFWTTTFPWLFSLASCSFQMSPPLPSHSLLFPNHSLLSSLVLSSSLPTITPLVTLSILKALNTIYTLITLKYLSPALSSLLSFRLTMPTAYLTLASSWMSQILNSWLLLLTSLYLNLSQPTGLTHLNR